MQREPLLAIFRTTRRYPNSLVEHDQATHEVSYAGVGDCNAQEEHYARCRQIIQHQGQDEFPEARNLWVQSR